MKKFSDWAAMNEMAAVNQDAGVPTQQEPASQQMFQRIRSGSAARQAVNNTAEDLGNPVAGAIAEISQGLLFLASNDPNSFKTLVEKFRQYLRGAGAEGVKMAGYIGQNRNRVMTAVNNNKNKENE